MSAYYAFLNKPPWTLLYRAQLPDNFDEFLSSLPDDGPESKDPQDWLFLEESQDRSLPQDYLPFYMLTDPEITPTKTEHGFVPQHLHRGVSQWAKVLHDGEAERIVEFYLHKNETRLLAGEALHVFVLKPLFPEEIFPSNTTRNERDEDISVGLCLSFEEDRIWYISAFEVVSPNEPLRVHCRLLQSGLNLVQLQNYRGFPHLSVCFSFPCTAIVAPNGAGKTALLDGIASLLHAFLDELEGKEKQPILQPFDTRRVQSPQHIMEPVFPTSLLTLYALPNQWSRWGLEKTAEDTDHTIPRRRNWETYVLAAAHSLRSAAQSALLDASRPPISLPVFAYYGTQRLWDTRQIAPKETKDPTPNARMRGYQDCLRSSARYALFVDWFRRYASEAQFRPNSPHQPQERLACVRQAIRHVLAPQGIEDIAWDFVEETVVVEHRTKGTLPADAMSDGIRTMLGLVGDLAHRAVRINPHFGAYAAQQSDGLVLIDEVDLHLHPDWQQSIVALLCEAFPRIQFIVTTHSPQVLSTVHASAIRVLSVDEEGTTHVLTPTQQTRGIESPDVMASVMGIDPLPPVPEARWMQEYRALVEQGFADTQEAQEKREDLEKHFGSQHPLLMGIDRLRRFQEFKQRRTPNAQP